MRLKNLLENKGIYDTLSKSEKTVYEYLGSNYTQIPLLHSSIVAQSCYCSTATVHRTIKQLGFESFAEFKYTIAKEIEEEQINNEDYDFLEDFHSIELDTLDDIAKKVIREQVVYVYGVGACVECARYLHRQFMLVGIPTIIIYDIHLMRNITSGTFISISNRGSQRLTINATMRAKNNGLNIVAITKKNSMLHKISDKAIVHNIETNSLDYVAREQLLHIYYITTKLVQKIRKIKHI